MTKIFAENSKKQSQEHKATRSMFDSINSKSEAVFTLIPGSTCGFSYRQSQDTVFFDGLVKNSGSSTAYSAYAECSVIFKLDDVIAKSRVCDYASVPHDISGGVGIHVRTETIFKDRHNILKIDYYLIQIKGYFYIDYNKKKKRDISLYFFYNPKQNTYGLCSSEEGESIFKSAIIGD